MKTITKSDAMDEVVKVCSRNGITVPEFVRRGQGGIDMNWELRDLWLMTKGVFGWDR